MNSIEKIEYLLSKKPTRQTLCEHSFKYFVIYYGSRHLRYPKLADYHHKRFEAVDQGLNIYCEGHRESAKTTILIMLRTIRYICYRKKRFVVNLCYDKTDAKKLNGLIANDLRLNQRLLQDFGELYTRDRTENKSAALKETGIGEFVTINGVKVKAFGIGEAVRGEVMNTKEDGLIRPDHLNIDDVDNVKNTKNQRIIEQDMVFLKQEVFGGLVADATITRVGNVVREDGRCVRHRQSIVGDETWASFSNFIYGEAGKTAGKIQWERFVESDEDRDLINAVSKYMVVSLESLQRTQQSGYKQNYLGIPARTGDVIIDIGSIKRIHTLPSFTRVIIGVDPAFSKKNTADAFGIVVSGYTKEGNKIALEAYKLIGNSKRTENATAFIHTLYKKHTVDRVVIEKNNGGELYADELKKKRMAVDVVHASTDKITRLKEYETDIHTGVVMFYEQGAGVNTLLSQLGSFTGEDGNEDDLVDAMVYSFKLESSQPQILFM